MFWNTLMHIDTQNRQDKNNKDKIYLTNTGFLYIKWLLLILN